MYVMYVIPGTSPCEFNWTCRGPFSVQPSQGIVPPRGKMDATVIWQPVCGMKNEDVLTLSVVGTPGSGGEGGGEGASESHLKVVGMTPETKVVIKEKKMEIGTCAVGIKQEKVIHIKNQHPSNPAIISLDANSVPGVQAFPEVFRLNAGETLPVTLTLIPPEPKKYQGMHAIFNVRGGAKSLKVSLIGESVVPDVHLDQATFEFGKVAIGSDVMLPLHLSNRGSIAAELLLDLTPFPGFMVYSLPADIEINALLGHDGATDAIDRESIIMPISPDEDNNNNGGMMTAGSGHNRGGLLSAPPGSGGGGGRPNNASFPKSPNTLARIATKWQIVLPPGIELKTFLVFSPNFLGHTSFALPLGLQGVATSELDSRLRVPVKGQGVEPRLIMDSMIDFGDRVVTTGPGSSNTYHLDVDMTNCTRYGLTWEIDESVVKNYKSKSGQNLFFLSRKAGDLASNEKDQLRITFNPRGPNDYRINVPLYLRDQIDRPHPYMTLRLRGSGIKPRLEFSQSQVMMPIVPLGVTSRVRFEVINQGFVAMDLKPKFPSYSPVEFSVTFPEGR